MEIPWLTPDQHAAIVAWVRRHGPAWSRRDCPEGLALREMRETHGEDWLAITQARGGPLH
jgi:hypothetical protein